MSSVRAIALACAALIAAAVAGCSSEDSSPTASGPAGDVTVFAASSLTNAFTEIREAFEAEYPGVNVTFNFAGTPTLRTQLEQGARADVFASADRAQMERAVASGVIHGKLTEFVTNRLVVITPAGGRVQSLADLAEPGVLLTLALPAVPAGAYAREALASLSGTNGLPADFADRVLANLVSEETNVRQVVAKVALGEADAGIVYQTDATFEGRDNMETIEIPAEANVAAAYIIAPVDGSTNPVTGAAFIDFVLSTEGQAILAEHGFGAAPE